MDTIAYFEHRHHIGLRWKRSTSDQTSLASAILDKYSVILNTSDESIKTISYIRLIGDLFDNIDRALDHSLVTTGDHTSPIIFEVDLDSRLSDDLVDRLTSLTDDHLDFVSIDLDHSDLGCVGFEFGSGCSDCLQHHS